MTTTARKNYSLPFANALSSGYHHHEHFAVLSGGAPPCEKIMAAPILPLRPSVVRQVLSDKQARKRKADTSSRGPETVGYDRVATPAYMHSKICSQHMLYGMRRSLPKCFH